MGKVWWPNRSAGEEVVWPVNEFWRASLHRSIIFMFPHDPHA